jgi:hypothetical protein
MMAIILIQEILFWVPSLRGSLLASVASPNRLALDWQIALAMLRNDGFHFISGNTFLGPVFAKSSSVSVANSNELTQDWQIFFGHAWQWWRAIKFRKSCSCHVFAKELFSDCGKLKQAGSGLAEIASAMPGNDGISTNFYSVTSSLHHNFTPSLHHFITTSHHDHSITSLQLIY